MTDQDDFARGESLLAQHDFAGAVASFDQVIAANANRQAAYYQRAMAYRGLAQIDQALADLSMAIQLVPEQADAYDLRGRLRYEHQHDYEGALADYSRAIALGSQQTYVWRGTAYFEQGDYQAAILDFSDAAKALNDPYWLLMRAKARAALGQYVGAISDCTLVIDREPRYAKSAYHDRAYYHANNHDYSQAIADGQHFLTLKADGPQAEIMRRSIRSWQNEQ